ncbi:MAG: hypothetical protein DRN00_01505 [Thermoplasmata archaeon]|nr:MAG: hypothetical protein DRN00_01505 [Thermoplasmata archaeon]
MDVKSGAEWVLGKLEFHGKFFHIFNEDFSNIQHNYTKIVSQNETNVSISVGVDYTYYVDHVATAPPVILTLNLRGELEGFVAAFALPRIDRADPLRTTVYVELPKNVSYKEYGFSATVRVNLHKFERGYVLKLKRNISARPFYL